MKLKHFTFNFKCEQIKEDKMGVKCNTYVGYEKHELLMEKTPLDISMKIREDDIKM
jgi:hypothetical protein